jgi:hypothetical protein
MVRELKKDNIVKKEYEGRREREEKHLHTTKPFHGYVSTKKKNHSMAFKRCSYEN